MKVKLYLDHLNPAFYRKMREAIVTGSPDFLFLVKNGYKKMFHVDLLTLLSTVIHNHIRTCRADGFKGNSMMLPSLGSTEIDCLHELIYKDVCEVDETMVDVVVKDLTELGFSVSEGSSNYHTPNTIRNLSQNNVENVQKKFTNHVVNHTQKHVHKHVHNDASKEIKNEAKTDVNNVNKETLKDVQNGAQREQCSDVQTDGHDVIQNEAQTDIRSDQHEDMETDIHTDLNNNVHSDTLETPISTAKKSRGCKVEYPLYFSPLSSYIEGKGYDSNSSSHRRNKQKNRKQEYEIAPSGSTWSSRLRIRKRKMSASSSADESATQDTPLAIANSPATTPSSTRMTESPTTPVAAISTSRRNSTKTASTSNDDGEEPNAISQEDRDIQRIVSVIKSFLPHPGCFLVQDGILECFVCGEVFRYRDNWRRHLLEQHFHLTFLCPTCGQKFKRRGKCSEHMLRCR